MVNVILLLPYENQSIHFQNDHFTKYEQLGLRAAMKIPSDRSLFHRTGHQFQTANDKDV